MSLRKKLLKMIVVMYGCTALLSFGDLPQTMIDDMKRALQYVGVSRDKIKQIQIQEMLQRKVKRGCSSHFCFDSEGCLIISLDKDMFSSYKEPVKQLLINHALLREAVRLVCFGRVEKKDKDCQCYDDVNSAYKKKLTLVEKSSKKSFVSFFVFVASFCLVNKLGIKVGNLGKILGGLFFFVTVNMCKNLFSFYTYRKKLFACKNLKNFFIKILEIMASKGRNNIIDSLDDCKARSDDFFHEFFKRYKEDYGDEHEEKLKKNFKVMLEYNKVECMKMRDSFLENVGTLAMMFYINRKNYNKYIKFLDNSLDNSIERQCYDESIACCFFEQRLYVDEFIKNVSSEKEIAINIWDAGDNKGPYAEIVDGYLREKILGLLEKDLQVYGGDVKEYIRARDQGKRPIYLKLQEPAGWL